MQPEFILPKEEGNIGEVYIKLKISELDRGFRAHISTHLNHALLGTDSYEYVVPQGEDAKDIKDIMAELGEKFSVHFEKAKVLGC